MTNLHNNCMRRIRVGFMSAGDPDNPASVSGMPHSIYSALSKNNSIELVLLKHRKESLGDTKDVSSRIIRKLISVTESSPLSSVSRINRYIQKKKLDFQSRRMDVALRETALEGNGIASLIDQVKPDVIFAVLASRFLPYVETEIPIVYFSDGVTSLYIQAYPHMKQLPKNIIDELDRRESVTMNKISAGIFPYEEAQRVAVGRYGLKSERAYVVPMGANLRPEEGEKIEVVTPSKKNLELICVASDPIRKQLKICLGATEILIQRGWNASLFYVGPPTKESIAASYVNSIGRLQLNRVADREKLKSLLRRSHFLLLPSNADFFPIAPCEAAHFGTPSIVSDVGGLPCIIQDNVTGKVLSKDARANEYAKNIEEISSSPEIYREYALASVAKAKSHFTWERFAEKTCEVLCDVAENSKHTFC